MATLATDIALAQQSLKGASARPDGGKVFGAYHVLEAVYTTTGAEAATDVIDIGILPEGCIVLPEKSKVACEASGGTGTAVSKLGDASDDDRYSATSIALTSAAVTDVTPAVATGVITRTPVTADTNTIKATLALTSGSVTAGKKIVFLIAFRKP